MISWPNNPSQFPPLVLISGLAGHHQVTVLHRSIIYGRLAMIPEVMQNGSHFVSASMCSWWVLLCHACLLSAIVCIFPMCLTAAEDTAPYTHIACLSGHWEASRVFALMIPHRASSGWLKKILNTSCFRIHQYLLSKLHSSFRLTGILCRVQFCPQMIFQTLMIKMMWVLRPPFRLSDRVTGKQSKHKLNQMQTEVVPLDKCPQYWGFECHESCSVMHAH